MVVLSFQAAVLHTHNPALKCSCIQSQQRIGIKQWRGGTNLLIRCGIAEPSGVPAPFGEKTKYKDGLFEKAFMTLFTRKMEKFAHSKPNNAEGGAAAQGETGKKGWFDYDYESFVEVSKRVIQGRNRMQQQEVVREVLLSILPPGAPAQVLPNYSKLFS